MDRPRVNVAFVAFLFRHLTNVFIPLILFSAFFPLFDPSQTLCPVRLFNCLFGHLLTLTMVLLCVWALGPFTSVHLHACTPSLLVTKATSSRISLTPFNNLNTNTFPFVHLHFFTSTNFLSTFIIFFDFRDLYRPVNFFWKKQKKDSSRYGREQHSRATHLE